MPSGLGATVGLLPEAWMEHPLGGSGVSPERGSFVGYDPALETPGYCQVSLRDTVWVGSSEWCGQQSRNVWLSSTPGERRVCSRFQEIKVSCGRQHRAHPFAKMPRKDGHPLCGDVGG